METVRIAAAVPVFVMQFDDWKIRAESVYAFEDFASDGGMLLDQCKLRVTQYAGLLQYVIRNSDLPDVVEQGADANVFLIRGPKSMARAMEPATWLTRWLCPAVYRSRASSALASDPTNST